MSASNGTYKILYLKSGSEYFPIGCLTENSFNEEVSMLDSTTRDNSDGWGSGVPTRQSYNISFSGLATFDDLGGTVISYSALQALKRGRTKIDWRIYSSLGGDTDYGSGYITSLSNSAAVDEYVSFSGEIIGTGLPIFEEGVPPVVNPLVDMIPIYNAAKAD